MGVAVAVCVGGWAVEVRGCPANWSGVWESVLAGWKAAWSAGRWREVGGWRYGVCKRDPRRLEALEKSGFDDVKKATAEVYTHVKASLISYRH